MRQTLKNWIGMGVMGAVVATGMNVQAEDEVTVTTDLQLPAGNIVIETGLGSGNNRWKYSNDIKPGEHRDVGQRFYTQEGAFVLDKIVLHIANISSGIGATTPGARFTLKLLKFTSSDDVEPEGEPIGVFHGTIPLELMPDHYFIMDIPNTPLEDGVSYGFLLAFDEPSSGNALNFTTGGTMRYTGGSIFFYTNSENANEMRYEKAQGHFSFYLISE